MPWAAGTYSRGYPSWSADAAGNLPISATKFDTEDNDFAGGINFCLVKDGSNSPTATLSWSIASAQPLALTRTTTDGTVFSLARTGGANNPNFTFAVGDTAGLTIAGTGGGLNVLNAGNVSVAAPTSGIAFAATGFAGSYAAQFTSANSGTENGVQILAGAVAGDTAFVVANLANSSNMLKVNGAGNVTIAAPASGIALSVGGVFASRGITDNATANSVTLAAGGGVTIAATSGTSLTVNGVAGQASLKVNPADSASVGFQLLDPGANGSQLRLNSNNSQIVIEASGISTALLLRSSGGTGLTIAADQGLFLQGATGSSQGVGTLNAQALYINGALFSPGVPINVQAGNYTTVLADANKCISNSGAANTTTIAANASVAYIVGTAISIYNNTAGNMTIAINTDTMRFGPAGTTGSRTLGQNGMATLLKIAATTWVITGSGLS